MSCSSRSPRSRASRCWRDDARDRCRGRPAPTSRVKAKSASQSPLSSVVVEDAADAARLVAVLQAEILVAPCLQPGVVGHAPGARRRLPAWRRGRRGCPGRSCVRRRSSTGVRSAPPPNQAFGRHHEARVHVHGGHERVPGMGDERNARGPEARDPPTRRGSGRGIPARTRRARSRCGRPPSRTRGRACMLISPPPPGAPLWSVRAPGLALESARRRRPAGRTGRSPRPPASRRRRRSGPAGCGTRRSLGLAARRARRAQAEACAGVVSVMQALSRSLAGGGLIMAMSRFAARPRP